MDVSEASTMGPTWERDGSFCFSEGPSSKHFDTLFRNEENSDMNVVKIKC
jgi:hypothetical protein